MLRISELAGLSYIAEVSALLQRARREHPTSGPLEAADYHWMWSTPRSTDDQPKVFWYDQQGPVAAAVTVEWGASTWLDPIVLPSIRHDLLGPVLERGLELPIAETSPLEILVGDDDEQLIDLLNDRGFQPEQVDATAWMAADEAPDIADLAEGYSLQSRASNGSPTHPFELMTTQVEHRLSETSLYRADLDLTVIDEQGKGAAHALFWFDPTTRVGLIEPVGTAEAHRGKGLASHLLTAGIHALVAAGSERITVSWELDNEAAVALYAGVGFRQSTTSSIWTPPHR